MNTYRGLTESDLQFVGRMATVQLLKIVAAKKKARRAA